ncbi:MAG: hypothetical protein ABFC55_00845 [Tenuifilaceae bacterium]
MAGVLLVAANLGEAISKGSVQTHTNPPVGEQVLESARSRTSSVVSQAIFLSFILDFCPNKEKVFSAVLVKAGNVERCGY